jgi:DNA-binding LytR/AlgR family response regulator
MYLKKRNTSPSMNLLQVDKVLQYMGDQRAPEPIAPFPLPPCGLDHSLFIRDNRTLHRVAVRDMLHLEADGNYVQLTLPDRRFVLRNSLSEVLKALPDGLFLMVNRRQAVNILLVDSVSTDEVTIGNHSYTLSPRFRDMLLERLHVISGR